MDVKYIQSDWDKMRDGIGDLIGLGRWGKGMIDSLKDLSDILEDAEADIAKYDSDRAISFSYMSQKSDYQGLFEDYQVLHRFTGKVGDIVDRTIDDPFYKDIDESVEAMRDLSISNYETTNRIGATETTYIYDSYGIAEPLETPKADVTLDDLLSGGSFYSEQIQSEYENWKLANPDEEISAEEYRMAAVNSRAFEYESIQDRQENKEFWVQMAALVVIVGVTIVCPVAGLALGAVYGTLELGSAISGEDWVSGREMDTSERWVRGLLAPLDIIPGVGAVAKFANIGRVGRVVDIGGIAWNGRLGSIGGVGGNGNRVIDSVTSGLNRVKETVTAGTSTVQRLLETATRAMTARLHSAQQFLRTAGNRALDHLANGAMNLARVTDTGINRTRQMGHELGELFNPSVSADGLGVLRTAPEDTHAVENVVRAIVGKRDDLNLNNVRLSTKTPLPNSFINQMDGMLEKYGIDINEFNEIKLKPMDELTDAEVTMLKDIRDSVPGITNDTSMQKTIPESDIEKYLNGQYSAIGGYVAKLDDVGHIRDYGDVVESSRLDYTTWDGSRPFPEDGRSYGKIEFTSNYVDNISIPYGAKFGGTNTDGYPCTLNGFTASRNGEVIPEWVFDDRYYPNNGAKLFRVTDGIEELVGVFDFDLKVFVPVK